MHFLTKGVRVFLETGNSGTYIILHVQTVGQNESTCLCGTNGSVNLTTFSNKQQDAHYIAQCHTVTVNFPWGGGGNSWEFLLEFYCPVLQPRPLFHTKNVIFTPIFRPLASVSKSMEGNVWNRVRGYWTGRHTPNKKNSKECRQGKLTITMRILGLTVEFS